MIFRAIQESWAKARIAADSEKLRREMEETREQQSHTSGLKPASTTVQKKQDAARERWGKLKAEAEERRQNPHETNRQPCAGSRQESADSSLSQIIEERLGKSAWRHARVRYRQGREPFVSLKKGGSPRTGLRRPIFENMQAEAKVI
jgi:hypothetical protein